MREFALSHSSPYRTREADAFSAIAVILMPAGARVGVESQRSRGSSKKYA
jgi:hypothetical protein